MELEFGKLSSRQFQEVRRFLQQQGLEPPVILPDYTVVLREDGEIAATGSLKGPVLQHIAVSKGLQGEGLCNTVISHLVNHAAAQGHSHLMLCTKPENLDLFCAAGFYPVAQTEQMLFMENRRDGAARFVSSLPRTDAAPVGAVVANCNPFTKGHRYLAEQAAKSCGFVYFFILSEDCSRFSAQERMTMASRSLADLPNVAVCPTGSYMISNATFPTYFLKDQSLASQCSMELDLTVFARCFAGPLGITRRFVGQEPFCGLTASYNRTMQAVLPKWGIEVVEIPRLEVCGQAVSASRVRTLLDQGDWGMLTPLVTEETARFLREEWNHGSA
ncbi:[citrate (pro-3S)-lyase] ligase [Dysosmobacter sp.]|uniref:[citrate (pro-3S)-lyase] ligase n=1 Tax=Dysosmobacter sp. TaxID=2591382 RepID=UPI00261001BC|nr:[citrate (pro-3S)-lyase] ligase [Dysosmobacter sp.]